MNWIGWFMGIVMLLMLIMAFGALVCIGYKIVREETKDKCYWQAILWGAIFTLLSAFDLGMILGMLGSAFGW